MPAVDLVNTVYTQNTEVANSGTSFTPSGLAGSTFVYTVTGAATINAPGGLVQGRVYTFIIIQNATGGFAVTWNAAYAFATAWSNTGNTASKVSVVQMVARSATTMRQAGAQMPYAT
jgi:uncharacterized protein YbdZ (MbtH family)